MGWGTEFNYPIYLSRILFKSKFDVEDHIREKEKDIDRIKKEILMYVSSNPKDITPKDWEEEGISFLRHKIDDLFEEFEDNHRVLIDLNRYLEVYDEQQNINNNNNEED